MKMKFPYIRIKYEGDLSKTKEYLERMQKARFFKELHKYGEKGVTALADATPKRTGKTAASWTYHIIQDHDRAIIEWDNTNLGQGWAKIALLIQYGHGIKGGGYVQPVDYINPALEPIFEELADEIWKEMTEE